MTDIDETEITIELVKATGEAAAIAYPDWTYGVSTAVLPSQGVGTWDAFAYRNEEGKMVSLFDHYDIDNQIEKNSEKLLEAQGAECVGLKCSVSRSGRFRVEYSYDIDDAIKWTSETFSGIRSEETVEILRPHDL